MTRDTNADPRKKDAKAKGESSFDPPVLNTITAELPTTRVVLQMTHAYAKMSDVKLHTCRLVNFELWLVCVQVLLVSMRGGDDDVRLLSSVSIIVVFML